MAKSRKIFTNYEVFNSQLSSNIFPKLKSPIHQTISIICPTYNEAKNLKSLVECLSEVMHDRVYEIIIVDDNSQDGTAKIAKKLSLKYPTKLVLRSEKLGLASAILAGFMCARGDILGVIDADFQHPPKSILNFINSIEQDNCDLVIGSRYIDGGGIEGWSKNRLLVSKLAVLLAKPLVRGINDPVSGFLFFRRKVIEGVKFTPTGFKLGLEILVKGNYRQVKEIPYIFKRRKNGKSKLDKKEVLSYIVLLKNLYIYKLTKR